MAKGTPSSMRAMLFEQVGQPLRAVQRALPQPGRGQLLLRVEACGVCRTDLHLLDGEVEIPQPPRILGHQIVGTIVTGEAASESGIGAGTRVGVPWLGWTCGECVYCRSGRENLCPKARFTGRDIDGGMAEYAVADVRYCFPIPGSYASEQAAPLLCAGLIGYRALRMCDAPTTRPAQPGCRGRLADDASGDAGAARCIGMYGFGASAHILIQVCRWQGRRVFAFTRAGDEAAQSFALELGADWAGASEDSPPQALDAAIVFAPVGELVPLALRALAPGGSVVCAGIHMSDIPSFPYGILWEERSVRSVANLTRQDGREMLSLAPRAGVQTHVSTYRLEQANEALADLRAGHLTGAAVLVP